MIEQTTFPSSGDQTAAAIATLRRDVDALKRVYGTIGVGSIEGTGAGGAGHIAALSITAASIAVGSVNADRLTSGVVSAAEILLGSGGRLVAGSTGTGARVVYDATGIEAYNASNVKTLDIDAATGSVTIVGGSLTAGSIYTATAPAARVEIDSSGIRGIAAGSVEKFRFDTATGSLSLTGVITAQSGSAVPMTYVTSGNIVSGTIITITSGGYLQTSPTNPRVVLDNAGLRAYNASGVVTAQIDATSSTFEGATFRTAPASGARVQLDNTGLRSFVDASNTDLTLTPAAGLVIKGGVADDPTFIAASKKATWVSPSDGIKLLEIGASEYQVGTATAFTMGASSVVGRTGRNDAFNRIVAQAGTSVSGDAPIIQAHDVPSNTFGLRRGVYAFLKALSGPDAGLFAKTTLLDERGWSYIPNKLGVGMWDTNWDKIDTDTALQVGPHDYVAGTGMVEHRVRIYGHATIGESGHRMPIVVFATGGGGGSGRNPAVDDCPAIISDAITYTGRAVGNHEVLINLPTGFILDHFIATAGAQALGNYNVTTKASRRSGDSVGLVRFTVATATTDVTVSYIATGRWHA